MAIVINDKKAPRFRPTTKTVMDNKFLKSFYSKYKHPKKSVSELVDIIKHIHEKAVDYAIKNPEGIEFPENLGRVLIVSYKPKQIRALNYKLSIEMGVPVKQRNLATDGYLMKIFYTNYPNKYHFKMRMFWAFKACRNFTVNASKEYSKNWQNYLVLDKGPINIGSILRMERQKENAKIKNQETLDNYNEFDIN
jgi:hypothetical protein